MGGFHSTATMDVTSKEWKSLFAIHPYHISQEEWEKMCGINPFMKEYPKGHPKHGTWYDGYRETPDPEAAQRLLDLLRVYNEYHRDMYFPMVHPLECQSIAFLSPYPGYQDYYPWKTSCLVPNGSRTWDLDAYILKMLDADPSTIQYIDVGDFSTEVQKKMAHVVLTMDVFEHLHGKAWEMYLTNFDDDDDEMLNPLCHFKMLLKDKEFVLGINGEYYTLKAILSHCSLLFDPDVCWQWLQGWEGADAEDEFYLVADYLNNQKKCPPMDANTCKKYLEQLEEGSDDHDHAKHLLRERLAEIA
jgi:hypothetical protein